MPDRQFNIEVLIKARNAASQAMRDLAKDSKKADENVKNLGTSSKDASKNIDKVNTSAEKLGPNLKTVANESGKLSNKLPDLNERIKSFSREVNTIGGRLQTFNENLKETNKQTNRAKANLGNAADAQKNLNAETRKLTNVINAFNGALASKIANTEAAEGATNKNKDAVKLKRAAVEHLTTATKDVTKEIDKKAAATNKARTSTDRHRSSVRSLSRELGGNSNTLSRLADKLLGVDNATVKASNHLRELALSARGFALAFVIKYAQALTSGIAGLAGEAVSLGSAFIGAGAAIGGAFVSGIMQAIPAVGLLLGALTRVTRIVQALNLRQQIQQRSGHDDTNDSQKQKRDLEQIATAEDSLAAAHENVTRAQEDLTKARADARREIEDLITAERDAELAARGAVLSQEEAQRTLRSALDSGDTAAVAQARLGVASSDNDLIQRRQSVQRAHQDADKARSGGVEGTDRIINARRSLADAERQAAHASHQLARAHEDTAQAAEKNTVQEDRLTYLIKQLSPAERRLYNELINFQSIYKKAFRGITDIIIESFTRAVHRAEGILTDNTVVTRARNLASKIAHEFDRISKFLTGGRSRGFLNFLSTESTFNLKGITSLLITAAKAIFNIAEAAAPVFRFILDKAGDVFSKLEFDTRGKRGADFFAQMKQDLSAIFDLARSIGRLFHAIFKPGQESGRDSIKQLAEDIDTFAGKLAKQPTKIKKFFDDSNRIFRAIGSVIFELLAQIYDVFNPDAVVDFTNVLKDVFIPALGNALQLMGKLTQALQVFLDLPVVRDVAQYAFTIFLFTRALDALRGAAASLISVFAGLFGARSKIAPFSPLIRNLILVGSAFLVLKGIMKDLGVAFDSLSGIIAQGGVAAAFLSLSRLLNRSGGAMKAYRSVVAVQTAGAAAGVIGFERKAKTALTGLRAAFATNPFGILLLGIGLASTALALFIGHNQKAKHAVEDLTDAIDRQTDAYRALRDQQLDQKDANLAVQGAELRLADSKARVTDVIKQNRKDGKVTTQEARDEKQAKLDVAQAEIDLTRARRRSKDVAEDKNKVEKEATKTSKDAVKGAKNNVIALKEERDRTKEKISELKKEDGQIIAGARGVVKRINNTKEIAAQEDKLKGITRKLAGANDDLRGALKKAAKEFKHLGGNAEDFGLTFSDVLKFLEGGANSALKAFGAKTVKFNTRYTPGESHPSSLEDFTQGDDTLSDTFTGRAQGGFLDGDGLQDSIPVMAAPGEAVINRHQIPFVDTALRASGIMGGGLSELFSRVQTPHYMAKGGFVQQAAANGGGKSLTPVTRAFAEKMFNLGFSVTSAFRPGDPNQHGKGQALDFGDSVNDLRRLWSYVFPLRRQFNQLLGPPGLYNGVRRFLDPGLQAQHKDHIHVGLLSKAIAGISQASGQIGKVAIGSNIGGFAPRLLRAMEKRIRNAGNRYLNKKLGDLGDFNSDIDFKKVKGGLSANQVKTFASRALGLLGINKQKSAWLDMLVARARQESSFDPNAINRTDINAKKGDPSRGLMQITGSNFKAYSYPGRNSINNPFDNILAAIAYMIRRWGHGNQGVALAQMLGLNAAKRPYAKGGFVHAATGLAPRVAFNNSQSSAASSVQAAVAMARTKASVGIFDVVFVQLRDFVNTVKGGNKKAIDKAVRDFTASDNGLIAEFANQFKTFQDRLANKLKAKSIKIKGKNVDKVFNDIDVAQQELKDFQSEQSVLLKERTFIIAAERAARKRGKKGKAALKAAREARLAIEGQIADLEQSIEEKADELLNLRTTKIDDKASRATSKIDRQKRVGALFGNTTGFAGQEANVLTTQRTRLQKVLDTSKGISSEARNKLKDEIDELSVSIIEKSAEAAQEAVDSINTNAERSLSAIDRSRRIGAIKGKTTGFSDQEGATLTGQRDQLSALLADNTIPPATRQQIQDQIAELTVQIAEKAVAAIQEQVDEVTKNADRALANDDRGKKLFEIKGKRTAGGQDAALRGQGRELVNDSKILIDERKRLEDLRNQALASGDTQLAQDLKDKLEDLNVTIAENSLAQQQNTDAIKQNQIDQILNSNSFISGVYGQAVQILQTLGNMPGNVLNTGSISNILNTGITQAQNTIQNLFGQLKPILQSLHLPTNLNLSDPTAVAEFFAKIAGANTSLLTPEQQTMFQTLVSEILSLTNGVLGLQDQLQTLNQALGPQSFATTAWQLFNQAIFNGEGALLPQFASLVPQMATGGMVTREGLFKLHAGEKVTPKEQVQRSDNMEHNWYITTPSEVLDPDYLASVMSFKLSTSSAVR